MLRTSIARFEKGMRKRWVEGSERGWFQYVGFVLFENTDMGLEDGRMIQVVQRRIIHFYQEKECMT